MATLFKLSKHWKNYDVFNKQKMSTFRSSRPAVLELASRYNELTKQLSSKSSSSQSEEDRAAAEKVLFTEMCEICLWGNATDLSLLTNLTYEDIQKLQGSKARKAAEANIIANDFDAAFELLHAAKKAGTKERRVDIVLDNAGFELFVDVILAGYLLQADLATTVVLHPKNIPWFVSDVVPKDFSDLLTVLVNAKDFYESPSEDDKAKDITPAALSSQESEDLQLLFGNWSQLYAEGKIVLRPNKFWTQGGSYWRLPSQAQDLFEDLKTAELVIFKGDLNYRKLTGDVSIPFHLALPLTPTTAPSSLLIIWTFTNHRLQASWDPTTPFTTAIGPLGPGSGMRTLALRTCKADVVVGLPSGEDERLRATENGGGDSGARKWAWSGKYAVVQLCDGKAEK
jgi:uncharacterized protein with ATP-grasp and redox domains